MLHFFAVCELTCHICKYSVCHLRINSISSKYGRKGYNKTEKIPEILFLEFTANLTLHCHELTFSYIETRLLCREEEQNITVGYVTHCALVPVLNITQIYENALISTIYITSITFHLFSYQFNSWKFCI